MLRVFYDRLIDDKDREFLFNKIRNIVDKNFPDSFDVVFKNVFNSGVRIVQINKFV